MSSSEILVIGSLNTDLVARVDRFPEPGETLVGNDFITNCGGKGANQAFAAGALGGKVKMIGQVGEDDFGTAQLENLASQTVQTNLILRDPHQPTGTALIGVESFGENRIIIIPGANGTFTPDRLTSQSSALQSAGWILLQLEIPAQTVATAIRIGHQAGAAIILDPAPASPLPDDWLAAIAYLTPNLSELSLLTSDTLDEHASFESITTSARKLCARGARCVIAKLGARGAARITATEATHFPAPSVQAIDTTAAGDCFNAAFAVKLSEGQSEAEAIKFAIAAASLSVTKAGAQCSMPKRSDVDPLVD